MNEDLTRLGSYVTSRRTECGYRTRKDLGNVLDFDYRVLSDIENGDRKAGAGSYAMLENALRWKPGSIAAILKGKEPTPIPDDPTIVVDLSLVPDDDLVDELRGRLRAARAASGRLPDSFPQLGAKAQRRGRR